jgi:hypothetical protein
VISSTCHFVNIPFHQFAISSTQTYSFAFRLTSIIKSTELLTTHRKPFYFVLQNGK